MSVAGFRDVVTARLAPWRVEDDREAATQSAPFPYVLVDFAPPLMDTDRWSSASFVADGWFQTTCIGQSRRQAEALHDRVEALLLDWCPTVPGWMVHPVGMDTAPRAQPPYRGVPDRVIWEIVTRWTWDASRAA